MGFLNWVKKHIVASVAIVVFPITLIICGGVMIKSKVDYDNYVVEYEKNVLITKVSNPISPSEVGLVENFTSKRAKKFVADAEKFVLPEGRTDAIKNDGDTKYIGGLTDVKCEITLNVNFEENSYCDITLDLATGNTSTANVGGVNQEIYVSTDDLLAVVSIKVNGEDIAGDVKLDVNEDATSIRWYTLAIKGIALPKGDNVISISQLSEAEKNYMPNIANAVVYADANVTF
mgnify:CR=1 FL=1